MKLNTMKRVFVYLIITIFLTSCNGFFKYSPTKENPTKGSERAKKNVKEGRGVSLGGLARGGKYKLSSVHPIPCGELLWKF